jgi:tetratricopeptide (TPR) repeat protein
MSLKFFGEEHPHVTNSLYSLAILHIREKEFLEAEEILSKILSIDRKLLGTDHPYVAQDLYTLADISMELKDYSRANRLLLESLKIRNQKLNSDHPDIYYTKRRLGKCLVKLKHYEEAERNLLESYNYFKIKSDQKEKYEKDIDINIKLLVKLYEAWSKPEKVAEYKILQADSTNNY